MEHNILKTTVASNNNDGNSSNNNGNNNTTMHQNQQKLQINSKNRKQSVTFNPEQNLDSTESKSTSESCPEFRGSYRIQTKAYERHSETPVSDIIHKRHSSNVYVNRLKQFYHLTDEDYIFPSDKHLPLVRKTQDTESSCTNLKINGKPNRSSIEKLPSFIRHNSDLKTTDSNNNSNYISNKTGMIIKPRKQTHNVTIILTSPSGKTTKADESQLNNYHTITPRNRHTTSASNSSPADIPSKKVSSVQKQTYFHGPDHVKNHATRDISQTTLQYNRKDTSLSFSNPRPIPFSISPSTTTVPPPVPILITPSRQRSTNTNNLDKSQHVSPNSSTLSQNDTQCILEAVQHLNSSSRRSSNAAASHHSRTIQQRKKRLSRPALKKESNNVSMRMSLPCRVGCCYCVYASLLGPVKVYLTKADRPKKEPWLLGIKDGNGKPVIPVSRKEDITGLVYDAHNHSFHPPSRGQRPLFPVATGHRMIKNTPVSKKREAVKKN